MFTGAGENPTEITSRHFERTGQQVDTPEPDVS